MSQDLQTQLKCFLTFINLIQTFIALGTKSEKKINSVSTLASSNLNSSLFFSFPPLSLSHTHTHTSALSLSLSILFSSNYIQELAVEQEGLKPEKCGGDNRTWLKIIFQILHSTSYSGDPNTGLVRYSGLNSLSGYLVVQYLDHH